MNSNGLNFKAFLIQLSTRYRRSIYIYTDTTTEVFHTKWPFTLVSLMDLNRSKSKAI